MSSFTLALVTSLAFATYAGSATAQSAVPAPPGNGAARPMLTLQMPPIPDPVPVTLKPASTALLVFDIVDPICTSQPKCVKTMVPNQWAFGTGAKSRRHCGIRDASANDFEVAAGSRTRGRRRDLCFVCAGPVFQYGTGQNSQG